MRINKILFIVILCFLIVNVYAESASPRSNLLKSFVPFLFLLIIIHLIIKLLLTKKVLQKGKQNIEHNLQDFSIVPLCGSIVVIISFFLPWFGDKIGPQVMMLSTKMFEMADYDSDFFLVGIFILFLSLSPIIVHLIIIINYLIKGFANKLLIISPLAIWLIELAILLANTDLKSVAGNLSDFELSIGFIGTFIGMVVTIYLSLTNVIPDSEKPNIINSSQSHICYNCGAKLKENSKFCPECGTGLEEDF